MPDLERSGAGNAFIICISVYIVLLAAQLQTSLLAGGVAAQARGVRGRTMCFSDKPIKK
jgi:hypothetical protein